MTIQEIRRLNQLSVEASASLAPIATGGSTDSHGHQPEPLAKSIARGLAALIEAGDLARRIREGAE